MFIRNIFFSPHFLTVLLKLSQFIADTHCPISGNFDMHTMKVPPLFVKNIFMRAYKITHPLPAGSSDIALLSMRTHEMTYRSTKPV